MRNKFVETISYGVIRCTRESRGCIEETFIMNTDSVDDWGDAFEIHGDNNSYIMVKGDPAYDENEKFFYFCNGDTTLYIEVVS